jgi:hypothetical protein
MATLPLGLIAETQLANPVQADTVPADVLVPVTTVATAAPIEVEEPAAAEVEFSRPPLRRDR